MKEAQGRELPALLPRGQRCGRAQARSARAPHPRAPAQGTWFRVRRHPRRAGQVRPFLGLGGGLEDQGAGVAGRDRPPLGARRRARGGARIPGARQGLRPRPGQPVRRPKVLSRLTPHRAPLREAAGPAGPLGKAPCGMRGAQGPVRRRAPCLGPRGRRVRRDDGLPSASGATRPRARRSAFRGPGRVVGHLRGLGRRSWAHARGHLCGMVSPDGEGRARTAFSACSSPQPSRRFPPK